MPNISWNEIQDRAAEFASKWAGETYEKGESQSFWSDFLYVYGIDRRRHGAYFEYAIKKGSGKQGFIDMFWPGKLLAEQKSGGKDLGKAGIQAYEYLETMPDHDLPQAIVVSDFATFQLIDLETRNKTEFTLQNFPKHVKNFAFLINERSQVLAEEDPVNRKAAEAMASLHNQLRDTGYTGHELELLLVRLVFCLFADDAQIFERGIFEEYLRKRTSEDGSDLGARLSKIFEVLNTPEEKRQTTLDEDLAVFPYVNGGLFTEFTRMPDFTSDMRRQLIESTNLDWSHVSPAIFGSMFQGVMDEKQRRNLGAHYTSEKNILKVIKPLFLDDLYVEFAKVRRSPKKLAEFHDKLANLTFLDPACGCGNFLVITYRELRRLEHKVINIKNKGNNTIDWLATSEHGSVRINVDQMYGIEIEEFPSLIAQTALWLTDHQMNMEFSHMSGKTFKRLPLVTSATIVNDNALTKKWTEVIEPSKLSYILGNPPFVGSKMMTESMRKELQDQFDGFKGTGILDFVSAWYAKAAAMMKLNPSVETALVSTNSIVQGQQPGVLWDYLYRQGCAITFAHQTFKWTNDAKGNAAVYCVIVGFAVRLKKPFRKLFLYDHVKDDPIEVEAKNIDPYLTDTIGPDRIIFVGGPPSDMPASLAASFIVGRSRPICDVPPMSFGNMPLDGGHLILSNEDRMGLLSVEPQAKKFIKPLIGAREFLRNEERWCLWLVHATPQDLQAMPHVLQRVAQVKLMRELSRDSGTRRLASRPAQFRDLQEPKSFLLVPRHSSERRQYIPIGFFSDREIPHDSCLIVKDANLFHFGIMTSRMHMAWMRRVAGRLKSDYRYSKDIVYNNFIWPDVSVKQKAEIERLAQAVLDARTEFPGTSLADLYDPLTMPPQLIKIHRVLDMAVDKLYQAKPFDNDNDRVALLFAKYEKRDV